MKTRRLLFPSKFPLMRIALAACLLCTSAFILSSCYKDRFNLDRLDTHGEWSPDVCAPLVNSKLGMDDILNDYDYHNLHAEDGTGFLYLVYEDKVYSQTAENFLIIPDQYVNSNYTFVVPGLPYSPPAYDNDYQFVMPNGEIITEVFIKAGGLNFNIPAGAFSQNATINLSIPGATKGGIPFYETLNYDNGIGINQTIDLAGTRIVFNNTFPNVNMLRLTYTANVTASGQPFNSPVNIPMGETFVGLRYSAIYGDFKQRTFNLENDSVKIRLFENVIHGSIDFQNPMIHLVSNNSCGMPVDVSVNNLRAVSNLGVADVYINGIPIPWSIAAPTVGQMGQFVKTQADFDRNNSNIEDAIYNSPEWFLSEITAIANPGSGVNSNFLLDTSRFDVNVQVELPLFGKSANFILQDTTEFNFGEDLGKVEFILFRINADNGFPVDAVMQLYFVSEDNIKLDSLLIPAQQVIYAAPTAGPPDYRVTAKVHTMTESKIEQPRLSNLKPTKKLVIRAKCNSVNNGTLLTKFYSDYTLDVRLAARAKFHIDF